MINVTFPNTGTSYPGWEYYAANQNYILPSLVRTISVTGRSANTIYFHPLLIQGTKTIADAQCYVNAVVPVTNAIFGLYNNDGVNQSGIPNRPGTLLTTSPTVVSLAVGNNTIGLTYGLTTGLYWLASNFDTTTGLNIECLGSAVFGSVNIIGGSGAAAGTSFFTGYSTAYTYDGSLPSSISSFSNEQYVPAIWVSLT